jgi:hypothetical protein
VTCQLHNRPPPLIGGYNVYLSGSSGQRELYGLVLVQQERSMTRSTLIKAAVGTILKRRGVSTVGDATVLSVAPLKPALPIRICHTRGPKKDDSGVRLYW